MAFSATSKRPWKINVIASADAKLSLPDVLPDGLAQAAHIQFNFEFPRERDSLATLVRMQGGVSIETQKRITRMKISSKKAVHQVGCGIDEICRRLAEDPVKRDMEICWSDFVTFPEWETRKTVLQPFSRLRESCSFRLGEVLGMQDDARQRLASYWEIVTSRVSV